LRASGLSEERFRGDGEVGSWDALPGVAMNLAIRHKVRLLFVMAGACPRF
jgi:hypothetical protein